MMPFPMLSGMLWQPTSPLPVIIVAISLLKHPRWSSPFLSCAEIQLEIFFKMRNIRGSKGREMGTFRILFKEDKQMEK